MNAAIKLSERALRLIQDAYVLIHDMDDKVPAAAKSSLQQIREWAIAILNEINRKL